MEKLETDSSKPNSGGQLFKKAGIKDDEMKSLNGSPPLKRKVEEPKIHLPETLQLNNVPIKRSPQTCRLIGEMREILDKQSFVELFSLDSDDSIIVAEGKIKGNQVVMCAHRLVAPGHSMLERQNEQIVKCMKHAVLKKALVIGIEDHRGVDIKEYEEYPEFRDVVQKSSCLEGLLYIRVQITSEKVKFGTPDKRIEDSFLFSITNTLNLNNTDVIYKRTQYVSRRFIDAKTVICNLFDVMPFSNRTYSPTERDYRKMYSSSIALDLEKGYKSVCDVKFISERLSNNSELFEILPIYGTDIFVGLIPMGGETFGVMGNTSKMQHSDDGAVQKGEKFLTYCQKFNIPLITIFDVPTLFTDDGRARQDVMNLSKAFKNVNTPKITIITRIGHKVEDDETVSKLFSSDQTYIWYCKTTMKPDMKLESASAKKINAEIIAPRDTFAKTCDMMRMLKIIEEHRKQYNSFASHIEYVLP